MERETLIEAIKTRAPQPIRCDRILVPTDGSGQAFRAVNEAIQLAAVTGVPVPRGSHACHPVGDQGEDTR